VLNNGRDDANRILVGVKPRDSPEPTIFSIFFFSAAAQEANFLRGDGFR
jgi:hypothetical protein